MTKSVKFRAVTIKQAGDALTLYDGEAIESVQYDPTHDSFYVVLSWIQEK